MSRNARVAMVEVLADRILGDEQVLADLMTHFEAQMRPGDKRLRRGLVAMIRRLTWMFAAAVSTYGPLPGCPMTDLDIAAGYYRPDGWSWP